MRRTIRHNYNMWIRIRSATFTLSEFVLLCDKSFCPAFFKKRAESGAKPQERGMEAEPR